MFTKVQRSKGKREEQGKEIIKRRKGKKSRSGLQNKGEKVQEERGKS